MITNKKLRIISIFLSLFFLLNSCGAGEKLKNIRKPVDLRTSPLDPDERARRNIEEGKGISIGGLRGNRNTNYEFSTSNPMWRASLETLDFLPLSTVDYSGGVIITDWYSENNSDESIKITLRFLSNEIRSDSLKIILHKKSCDKNMNCKTNIISTSTIKDELRSTILRKASLLEKTDKQKK